MHQSAKDYFQEIATSKISAVTKGKHHEVFSRSLQALSRQLRRNMYELDDWGIPTDQITPPTPDPLAATRYSCIHWVDHLSECRYEEGAQMDDLRDGGSVDEFLRKNYLHWLEALSIIVSVPEGIRALLKLKELLQVKINRVLIIEKKLTLLDVGGRNTTRQSSLGCDTIPSIQ